MRVLVGTLYNQENEFHQSRASILAQKNCEVDQIVIQEMREYDAHNLLWHHFNLRKKRYDLIAKVDADTVLDSELLFSDVHSLLKSSKFDGVQLELHDWLSQSDIMGLGLFLPKVEFLKSRNKLFADRSIDRKKYAIGNRNSLDYVGPSGTHCSNPSHAQSFRYGLHRMQKKQYHLILRILDLWQQTQSVQREFALLGAINAVARKSAKVNYSDEEFISNLKMFRNKSFRDEYLEQNIKLITGLID